MEYQSITQILKQRKELHPHKIAFTFLEDGESLERNITYAELFNDAQNIARHIQTFSNKREPVLLLYPQGIEFIKSFYGTLLSGSIAIPSISPKMNRSIERLKAIVDNAGTKYILTMSGHLKESIISLLIAEGYIIIYTDSIRSEHLEIDEIKTSKNDLAFLQYTSGSTGSPKGVMVSHGNIFENQLLIRRAFQQNESSVIVSWLPFYHDMGLVGKVIHPVFVGARCIFMSPTHFLLKPVRWLKAISKYNGTGGGAPNFAYDLCVSKITDEDKMDLDLSSWHAAFCGAEPIRANTLRNFVHAFAEYGFKSAAFQPCYGMAETTLFISSSENQTEPVITKFTNNELQYTHEHTTNENNFVELVSCGKVSDILYDLVLVDNQCNQVCSETIGEIWINGASVAQGYWHNPDLTSESFAARINGSFGKTYFRTGDLGIIKQDQLYITGRLKDLIIINGRNYYPQDIEQTVIQSSSVIIKDACAAFSIDSETAENLVIVCELDAHIEKDFVSIANVIKAGILKEWELQIFDLVLIRRNTILKTTSGKIQRQACKKQYLQKELAVIYQDIFFNKNEVKTDVNDIKNNDFLDLIKSISEQSNIHWHTTIDMLGLNSIKITQSLILLEEMFDRTIPIELFFESTTLQDLYQRVNSLKLSPSKAITSISDTSITYPLTPYQQGIWFDLIFNPLNTSYNLAIFYRIGTQLDILSFEKAFNLLIQRHEIIRSYFETVEDIPFFKINPYNPSRISVHNLEGNDTKKVNSLLSEIALMPFYFDNGPLYRAHIIFFNQTYYFFYVTHHIISDGTSLQILINELVNIYNDVILNKEPAKVETPQYHDLSLRIQNQSKSEKWQRSQMYWTQKLKDFQPTLLPFDFPIQDRSNISSRSENVQVSNELFIKLKNLSYEHHSTIYGILLSALFLLLKRISNTNDITICCPVSLRDKKDLISMQGMLVNTVMMRHQFKSTDSCMDLIKAVKNNIREAITHAWYPLKQVIEDLNLIPEPGKFPISQVSFNGINFASDDNALDIFHHQTGQDTNFDINFYVLEGDLSIKLRIDYRSALFKEDTIKILIGKYLNILDFIASYPGLELKNIILNTSVPLLKNSEDANWYSPQSTIVDVVNKQFQRYKARIAIQTGSLKITYEGLGQSTDMWGREIATTTKSQNIGIYLSHDAGMVIAMLSVLKAGKCYVFIDTSFPNERIDQIVKETEVSLIITDSHFYGQAQNIFNQYQLLLLDNELIQASTFINLPTSHCDSPAYILYTSGSTGKPKGILQTHGNLLHFVSTYTAAVNINSNDQITGFSSYAFDSFSNEVYGALLNGATYHPLDIKQLSSSSELYDWLISRQITVWQSIPTLFRYYATEWGINKLAIPTLKMIKMTGEPVRRNDFQLFKEITNENTLFMVSLGSTECSLYLTNTFTHFDEYNRSILPVGFPIKRTYVKIVDEELNELDVLEPGEIIVFSDYITPGYINKSMSSSVFGYLNGMRYYKTGDFGRKLHDGRIEWLYRKDFQVKIRGIRVETAEIEQQISRFKLIQEVAVTAHEDNDSGDVYLTAYVISKQKQDFNELRDSLRQYLPENMIPSYFIEMEKMPLTSNGKIDRKRLPEPQIRSLVHNTTLKGPENELELRIFEIWTEVLGTNQISTKDNFFEIGGNSLKAMKVISRISNDYNKSLKIKDLYANPTIHFLAIKLKDLTSNVKTIPIHRVLIDEFYELSHAQKRIWVINEVEENLVAYNMGATYSLIGKIDFDALERAYFSVLQRHESLRTTFIYKDGIVKQKINEILPTDYKIKIVDLINQDESNQNKIITEEEAYQPFKLNSGPLIRAKIIIKKPEEYIFIVEVHHIVFDGWSEGVFISDLLKAYDNFLKGSLLSLDELGIQYKDYSDWHNKLLEGNDISDYKKFWLNKLDGDIPQINLPYDYDRPYYKNYHGAGENLLLSKELTEAINNMRIVNNTSLFTILFASVNCLLFRITGQNDIIIGTPISGREKIELENQIGFFVNTLPIRTKIPDNYRFIDLLKKSSQDFLEAIEFSMYPFDFIIEDLNLKRDLSRSPVFDVMFIAQNNEIKNSAIIDNLSILRMSRGKNSSHFDLMFEITEIQNRINISLEYNSSLFKMESIVDFLNNLESILIEVSKNSNLIIDEISLAN